MSVAFSECSGAERHNDEIDNEMNVYITHNITFSIILSEKSGGGVVVGQAAILFKPSL